MRRRYKVWMGHAKLTTPERYLHAMPRHSDVARLNRAFTGSMGELDEQSERVQP